MLIFIAITAFFAAGVGYNIYNAYKENHTEEQSLEMDMEVAPEIINQDRKIEV
jgi:hypothetical protein